MILLWKGFHSPELRKWIEASWKEEDLLILCPPLIVDFSFLSFLPGRKLELIGEWNSDEREKAKAIQTATLSERLGNGKVFPVRPVLGVFTSGTAGGIPRLILYSKKNIESSLEGILKLFDASRIEAIFCYPQPFHTFGLNLGYVQSVLTQKPLIECHGKYNSQFHALWGESAARYPGLLTLGTPTHFLDLLTYYRKKGIPPSPTYTAIVGGASTSVSLWRSLREELLISAPSIGYGCTEASPGLTHLPPGVIPEVDGEIGEFLENVEYSLVPNEGLRFSGPQMCLAVIDTAGIQFPNSILVKDHLQEKARGGYQFLGRFDLVLNRGGIKISIEEVEIFLMELYRCDVLAVAIPNDRLGEELGLLVKNFEAGSEKDWKRKFKALLMERYGILFNEDNFQEVEAFPLNASSKVDRKAGAKFIS